MKQTKRMLNIQLFCITLFYYLNPRFSVSHWLGRESFISEEEYLPTNGTHHPQTVTPSPQYLRALRRSDLLSDCIFWFCFFLGWGSSPLKYVYFSFTKWVWISSSVPRFSVGLCGSFCEVVLVPIDCCAVSFFSFLDAGI